MRELKPAIQVIECFSTEHEANNCLNMQEVLDGYLGGRVIPPSPSCKDWRMQAFHEAPEGLFQHGWLPDGMRLVVVPSCLRAILGF